MHHEMGKPCMASITRNVTGARQMVITFVEKLLSSLVFFTLLCLRNHASLRRNVWMVLYQFLLRFRTQVRCIIRRILATCLRWSHGCRCSLLLRKTTQGAKENWNHAEFVSHRTGTKEKRHKYPLPMSFFKQTFNINNRSVSSEPDTSAARYSHKRFSYFFVRIFDVVPL